MGDSDCKTSTQLLEEVVQPNITKGTFLEEDNEPINIEPNITAENEKDKSLMQADYYVYLHDAHVL